MTETANPSVSFDRFALWKEYEGVAMHFNDLIIRLRTQSLAAVAAFATIAGILTKNDATPASRWEVMSGAFGILSAFWVAIWVLDQFYYNKLLSGAVRAILDIEKESAGADRIDRIDLSTKIENHVQHGPAFRNLSQHLFYLIVLLVLLTGLALSVRQSIATPTADSAPPTAPSINFQAR
jgi:hypothetical protein